MTRSMKANDHCIDHNTFYGECRRKHGRSVVEFKYESATCRITNHGDGEGDLTHVYSIVRRSGHARGLLRLAMEYADENDLFLYLRVGAYGSETQTMMSNSQLIDFYQQFGFIARDGSDKPVMIRPRTKNTPYSEREN